MNVVCDGVKVVDFILALNLCFIAILHYLSLIKLLYEKVFSPL